jgi:hypothetical protein
MSATYSRLNSGKWGIRVRGTALPGQQVMVTTLSGKSQLETLDEVVWKRNGVSLCTIRRSPSAFAAAYTFRRIGPRHHPGQQMLDL